MLSSQFGITRILLLANMILVSWLLFSMSRSASLGIKNTLDLETASFLPLKGFGDGIRNVPGCMPSTEYAERISFKTPTNPYLEPVDCAEFLDFHRKKEIALLRNHTDELPHHKSYLRLTNTEIPFYQSTNDPLVDSVRKDIFIYGQYYERLMSVEMQSILEEVTAEMKAGGNLKRPIMLDVGGNVGWFSMLSAAHGAEVFVFEPNVVNMVRLCESSVLNGWSSSPNQKNNRVHPFLKGVSDVHGSQEEIFAIDPGNPGSFSFSKEAARQANAKTAEVGKLQLVTLDALAGDQNWLADAEDSTTARIAILKIDVEGLELSVLKGAKQLLRSHKVHYIFMEWKKNLKSQNWEEMCAILLDSGYELFKTGAWLGPSDVVVAKFPNGTELANYVRSTYKAADVNVLFRLASSNE
jgi:FkbM family methyltransferase